MCIQQNLNKLEIIDNNVIEIKRLGKIEKKIMKLEKAAALLAKSRKNNNKRDFDFNSEQFLGFVSFLGPF